VELIRSGVICAVVNTPSPQSGVLRDALEIRLAAVEEGLLCLTTMETAVAAAESLAVRRSLARTAIGPLGNGGLREPLR
jgi:carbamoyl-phosphate synthase large subunit